MTAVNKFANGHDLRIDSRPVPKKTFTPAGHLCVGHQLKNTKTTGGIILPDGGECKKQFDTIRILVIAVGPDVTNCKPGDVLLVGDQAPAEIVTHKGQLVVVFRDDNFLGIEDGTETAAEA